MALEKLLVKVLLKRYFTGVGSSVFFFLYKNIFHTKVSAVVFFQMISKIFKSAVS